MKKLFIIVLSLFALMSCDDDDNVILSYEEQLKIDIAKIKNYLSENELTADSTQTGLFYIIETEGTGSYPTVDSVVEVGYVGRLLANDEVFTSDTITEELSLFIPGWKQGLQLFNEGSKGTLFIPSGLAYGPYEYYEIPANSVLIFDIELFSVSNE